MTAFSAMRLLPRCACASVSHAQDAPAPSGPTLFGLTGTIDVGVRVTSTDGDAARYERYRDLRSGVFSGINLGQKNDQRLFGIRIEKVGYRDQSYAVDYNGGRTRASGSFDSIPLNYSYITSTPWVEQSPGVLYARRRPFLHFHLTRGRRRRADVKGRAGWTSLELPRPISATKRQAFRRLLRARYRETELRSPD